VRHLRQRYFSGDEDESLSHPHQKDLATQPAARQGHYQRKPQKGFGVHPVSSKRQGPACYPGIKQVDKIEIWKKRPSKEPFFIFLNRGCEVYI